MNFDHIESVFAPFSLSILCQIVNAETRTLSEYYKLKFVFSHVVSHNTSR